MQYITTAITTIIIGLDLVVQTPNHQRDHVPEASPGFLSPVLFLDQFLAHRITDQYQADLDQSHLRKFHQNLEAGVDPRVGRDLVHEVTLRNLLVVILPLQSLRLHPDHDHTVQPNQFVQLLPDHHQFLDVGVLPLRLWKGGESQGGN